MRHLVANRWKTPDGTILESLHRHDYVTHGEHMVDGGTDYVRRSTTDMEDLCVYSDDPFEVIRQHLKWGTYGINGDQPLKYIPLADMEDGHIEAVMKLNIAPWRKILMEQELEYRNASNTNQS